MQINNYVDEMVVLIFFRETIKWRKQNVYVTTARVIRNLIKQNCLIVGFRGVTDFQNNGYSEALLLVVSNQQHHIDVRL